MDFQNSLQYQALPSNLYFKDLAFSGHKISLQVESWRDEFCFRKNTLPPIDFNEIRLGVLKSGSKNQQNSLKDQSVDLNSEGSGVVKKTKLEIDLKAETSLFAEDETHPKYIKEETNDYKQESNTSSEGTDNVCFRPFPGNLPNQQPLLDIISNMLLFFIKRFGKTCQNEIIQQRMRYAWNDALLRVFDILVTKYQVSSKSREDMVRFCIRKALAFLRDNIKNELKITQRGASLALCKKYFQNISGKIKLKENCEEKEINDKILNFLLPYKKNSRNKTPNACLIKEFFSSEEFLNDYIHFLSEFDDLLSFENFQKITKFNYFIYECVIHCAIDKISGYMRLPWLDFWIESTKILARELVNIHGCNRFCKKSKE